MAAFMKGSGKASPLVDSGLLLAGGGDGVMYTFNRTNGKQLWKYRTGGEILAQPMVYQDRVYFGSGDGLFYSLNRTGEWQWSVKIGHPVYSAAVAVDGKIVVAANNGHIYAFDPIDGTRRWECDAPGYSIESRPWVSGDTVYYGSWDGYVYALDGKTGEVRWKTQGVGSKASLPGVARYYAPADAGPVVSGGKVWIADRLFRLERPRRREGDGGP